MHVDTPVMMKHRRHIVVVHLACNYPPTVLELVPNTADTVKGTSSGQLQLRSCMSDTRASSPEAFYNLGSGS